MPPPTVVVLPCPGRIRRRRRLGCPDPGCPDTCTSAGKRGVTAKRWSEAVGAGRRAIPTTVALRPSTSVVLAIPAPGWPTTTTRSLPTAISARQRSPSLWTLSTWPVTDTRRHSWAAAGAAWRTSGAGTGPLPRDGEPVDSKARGSVRDTDPTLGMDPRARPAAQPNPSAATARQQPRRPGRRSVGRSRREASRAR